MGTILVGFAENGGGMHKMRLIDADSLERDLFDAEWVLDNDEHMIQDILCKYPTIDAVEVVCCKDCKWYDPAFYVCSKCGVCVDRSFFCADGERKE